MVLGINVIFDFPFRVYIKFSLISVGFTELDSSAINN